MEPVSEFHEEEVGSFSTAAAFVSGILSMSKSKTEDWTIEVSLRFVSYSIHNTLHTYTSFVSFLVLVSLLYLMQFKPKNQ